jgi:hypothetical protein
VLVPIHNRREAPQLAPPGHGGNFVGWGGHIGRTLQPSITWEQEQQQPMMQDLITGWIDLDAMFPTPENACNEPLVDFRMPRWGL